LCEVSQIHKNIGHERPDYINSYLGYNSNMNIDLKLIEEIFNKEQVKNIFENEFKILKNKLTKIYGKGFIIRAILVNLKSKSNIGKHIDNGESLSICHRIHIPIITNRDVFLKLIKKLKT